MEEQTLKVIIDVQTIPDYLDLEQIHNIMKNSGIVIWDSSKNGIKPEVIEPEKLRLLDVKFYSKPEFKERFQEFL